MNGYCSCFVFMFERGSSVDLEWVGLAGMGRG